MTLTACIKTKDGIILASDSKASSTITSNDTVKKIFKLDDHTAVGIAGDGPLALYLLETISKELNFQAGIFGVTEKFRELAKKHFDEWFSHQPPLERPGLDIILAGYNGSDAEIYRLNSNDNFVPRKCPTGFECIGVPYIAEYLLNRLYEPEVTSEQALTMATFCIKETSTQHRGVGGPTQLAQFSPTKSFSMVSLEKIREIEGLCVNLHVVQKASFYPENTTSGNETPTEATKA
jgi:20S proteasome alpha/beta subunit